MLKIIGSFLAGALVAISITLNHFNHEMLRLTQQAAELIEVSHSLGCTNGGQVFSRLLGGDNQELVSLFKEVCKEQGAEDVAKVKELLLEEHED